MLERLRQPWSDRRAELVLDLLQERGYTLPETGNVMTVFLLLGGLGGLAGGLMAERVSGRAVTL